MKKVIIDCDPGHDDALAIILAKALNFEILAMGTVAGNNTLANVTRNAQIILELLDETIPLYRGSERPLMEPLHIQPEAHGKTGMDGHSRSLQPKYPVESMHAVTAYKNLLETNDDVCILALGPLTNIALLLSLYPQLQSKIDCISIMGGGLKHGNVTQDAEFNFWQDPEAAKIVFNSGVKILLAPLDVTEKAYLEIDDIDKLKGQGLIGQFCYELLGFYYESGKKLGFTTCAIHDACAVAALAMPELFDFEEFKVEISLDEPTRGKSIGHNTLVLGQEASVSVALDVDRTIFSEMLINAVKSL